MIQDLTLPFIGEDIDEATVNRILVRKRHKVKKEEIYLEVGSDKVDIGLPSPFEGVVVEILVEEGEKIRAGQALIRIAPEVSDTDAEKLLAIADLFTALNYLITLDSASLCGRKELQSLTFEAFKKFVDDATALAQSFVGLPLEDLDRSLQEELRAALFFVTDLTKLLVAFDPPKLGIRKFREHKRIYDALAQDSEYSTRLLRDLLVRTAGGIEFDPAKAYVFISYSHHDAAAAFELAEKLRMAHVPYFLDKKTGFGERIPARVQQELRKASHVIVLISLASVQSAWVHYEIGFARARGISTIPLLLQEGIQVPLFLAEERCATKAEESEVVENLAKYMPPPEPVGRQLTIDTFKSAFVRQRLGTARRMIWHQSMASYPSIQDSVRELKAFVRRGGQFWCILSDPAGQALASATIRNVGKTRTVEHLDSQFRSTCRLLAQIGHAAANGGEVVLKTIDFVPEPILTLLDPESDEGSVFVTLSGFGQRPDARPSFLLLKEREAEWFSFYTDSFLKLWDDPLAQTVDLYAKPE